MQYDEGKNCIYITARILGFQIAFTTASGTNQLQKKDHHL